MENAWDSDGEIRTPRTNTDDVELKSTLQQLLLNLVGDAVKTDIALGVDAGLGRRVHHRRSHCGRNRPDNRFSREELTSSESVDKC